jgi:hypothetical protein
VEAEREALNRRAAQIMQPWATGRQSGTTGTANTYPSP